MLSNYSDYQNNLLNRVAYCDLGEWNAGDDLLTVLENSEDNDCKDLAEKLRSANITDLKIKDYVNNNDNSGFAAIAFEDANSGEVGISFRGTENLDEIISDIGNVIKGGEKEQLINNQIDMIDNASTAITGDSLQAQEALAFYLNNRSEEGKNILFGHSKGGELAAEVFSEYFDEILCAHVINPQPINWTKLTKEQKAVFKSSKFDATVIDGDFVWLLGGVPYPVRIIKNNGSDDSLVGPHFLTSAKYDEETGEAEMEEEPYKEYIGQGLLGSAACIIITGIQSGYANITELRSDIKEAYEIFAKDIKEGALKLYDAIVVGYNKIKDSIIDVNDSIENFINIIGSAVKDWYNSTFNKGNISTAELQVISVDTQKLRSYAQRLQSVNSRVSRLDSRLDSLYWNVGLLGLWNLMQADMLTGYSWRLNRCSSYLNETANDLEQIEQNLKNVI